MDFATARDSIGEGGSADFDFADDSADYDGLDYWSSDTWRWNFSDEHTRRK